MHLQLDFVKNFSSKNGLQSNFASKKYSPSVFYFFCYQNYLQSWEILRMFQCLGHCDFLNFESVRTSRLVSGRKLIALTNKKASRVEHPFYMENCIVDNFIQTIFLNSLYVLFFVKKRIIFFRNFNTFALLIIMYKIQMTLTSFLIIKLFQFH